MARSTTTLGSARRRAGPCALAPAPTAARGGRAAACRRAEGAPAAALPAEEALAAVARRGVLRGGGLGGLGAALGAAAAFPAAEARAAGAPKGFNVVKNPTKGYAFAFPFGWQEVAVDGQEVVYKDVIEPLESVSLTIYPSQKESITEYGDVDQVASSLISRVLAAPGQETKVLKAKAKEQDGKTYYQFEYVAQAPNFTRHALTTVGVNNGSLYTLTTGANQRRWKKMEDRLNKIVDSFQFLF